MIKELESFLAEREKGAYEREGFDKYCAKRKLSLSCPVIHITGSNGKGSTAFFLESIYRKAGYRVALFSKPFLYAVNETMRVDGKEISDAELQKLFNDNRKDFDKFGLSGFECTVALAYRYFESQKVDLAIIEAGMGGMIDATNLDDLDTRLAIITSVSLEHTSYLGTTVSQIALHKAGIMKPGVPVLVGELEDSALDTLRAEAKSMGCPFNRVEKYHFEHLVDGRYHFDYATHKDVVLGSGADYQLRNASLAMEATRLLEEDFPVKEEDLRAGIEEMNLPCRLERFGRIVLDGAHNPEAIDALVRNVGMIGKSHPVHVLFASFRDKNIAVELPALANAVADITLTTFEHPRARKEEDYFLYVADHPFVEDAIAALRDLLERYPEDAILVTGSLNFVGFMRQRILEENLELK